MTDRKPRPPAIPLPARIYFQIQNRRNRIRRQLLKATRYARMIEAMGADPVACEEARALVEDAKRVLRSESRRLKVQQRDAVNRLVKIAHQEKDGDVALATWLAG